MFEVLAGDADEYFGHPAEVGRRGNDVGVCDRARATGWGSGNDAHGRVARGADDGSAVGGTGNIGGRAAQGIVGVGRQASDGQGKGIACAGLTGFHAIG